MGYYDKEQVLQILLHEVYVATTANNLERVTVLSQAYQRIASVNA